MAKLNHDYEIDNYTAAWDEAARPRLEPVAGEVYRTRLNGAADGRELVAFLLRLRELGLVGEFVFEDAHWHYFELAVDMHPDPEDECEEVVQ